MGYGLQELINESVSGRPLFQGATFWRCLIWFEIRKAALFHPLDSVSSSSCASKSSATHGRFEDLGLSQSLYDPWLSETKSGNAGTTKSGMALKRLINSIR